MYLERYDKLLDRLRLGKLHPKYSDEDFRNIELTTACIVEYASAVTKFTVDRVMPVNEEIQKRIQKEDVVEQRLYDSCVASMKVVNSLCEKYGVEKVFNKIEAKEDVQNSAIAFEMEVFAEGIAKSKREQKKAAVENIQDILGAD